MRTLIPLALTIAALVACGGKKEEAIDDPQLQASGAALGEQSSDMAAMDAEADDGTVQSNVQAVGGTLQAAVSQHQAIAQSSVASLTRSQARQTTAEEPVYWDGSELCIDIDWDQAGATISYDVVLDITTSGSDSTINGTYDLVYDLGVAGVTYDYDISAVYDNVTTSGGCAVSGSMMIDYTVDIGGFGGFGGQNESGRMTITYNGCDDVTITGS